MNEFSSQDILLSLAQMDIVKAAPKWASSSDWTSVFQDSDNSRAIGQVLYLFYN